MIKYLYIDDDYQPALGNCVPELAIEGELSVEYRNVIGTWESEIDSIKKALFEECQYQGVILDLKLDVQKGTSGSTASYQGCSLAQEIRGIQKTRLIKDANESIEFPIVLYTANAEQFDDGTADDLFDLIIHKGGNEDWSEISNQLLSLSKGYNLIAQKRTEIQPDVNESEIIAGLLERTVDNVDFRCWNFIEQLLKNPTKPIHDVSRFIINEVLSHKGMLIDESVLAARLGIDINASNDWKQLLNRLDCIKYKGVFSLGWDRWWSYDLFRIWTELSPQNPLLQDITAEERVDMIAKKYDLTELKPSQMIDGCKSTKYWTICKECNRPLDPFEGLAICNQENLYPWQEKEYISKKAFNEGSKYEVSIEDMMIYEG